MISLAIDIGNTMTHFGVIEDREIIFSSKVLTSDLDRPPITELSRYDCRYAGISSVVPNKNSKTISYLDKELGLDATLISKELCPIGLSVSNPSEVGADRICNSVAAVRIVGGNSIVIDFGSATTFDVIDSTGSFIGGAICPGMDVAARNLFNAAALLSDVELQFPEYVIGKSTDTNLQSGIMFGAVAMVEGMVSMIAQELDEKELDIIVTGGFGEIVSNRISLEHRYDPYLTLRGIDYIISP